jgi:hypothetical protein
MTRFTLPLKPSELIAQPSCHRVRPGNHAG